jgi:hypothetical protein
VKNSPTTNFQQSKSLIHLALPKNKNPNTVDQLHKTRLEPSLWNHQNIKAANAIIRTLRAPSPKEKEKANQTRKCKNNK